jgi:transposase
MTGKSYTSNLSRKSVNQILATRKAGPLSQWLFSALAEAELPVVCVETRHMSAVLKAGRCKSPGAAG